MNALGRSRLIAKAQTVNEALWPGTLVVSGHTFPVVRSAWQNTPDFRDDRDQDIEVRTCAIRIRKALLTTAGVTLLPGHTSGTLDGVAITLPEQTAGDSVDGFRFTVRAVAPEAPQS